MADTGGDDVHCLNNFEVFKDVVRRYKGIASSHQMVQSS